MIPAFALTGRVALVTGAGNPKGIGFASAQILASLGASVMISSTTNRIEQRVAELRDLGAAVHGIPGDLTDPTFAEHLISETQTTLGSLDILVQNAGMTSISNPEPAAGTIETTTPQQWHEGIARKLDSTYFVAKAAMSAMQQAQWGRMIFIASVTGPAMAMRGEPIYAAAKAGMVGLARALAVDVADQGITVNAIAPGWIQTDSQTPAEYRQGLATPMGRSADPSEIASAVAWLAAPGSSYITGQCIVVDGGNSISEERG